MKREIEVQSFAETQALAERLAPFLKAQDLLLLDGDLGAGKTTFTKGLAKGLGIKRPVKSPTFTIIKEYQGGTLPLYHMDIYRLEHSGSDELGLDEYFNGDGIVVIEWSEFIDEKLPDDYLKIIFKREDNLNSDTRKLVFEPAGSRFNQIVEELLD